MKYNIIISHKGCPDGSAGSAYLHNYFINSGIKEETIFHYRTTPDDKTINEWMIPILKIMKKLDLIESIYSVDVGYTYETFMKLIDIHFISIIDHHSSSFDSLYANIKEIREGNILSEFENNIDNLWENFIVIGRDVIYEDNFFAIKNEKFEYFYDVKQCGATCLVLYLYHFKNYSQIHGILLLKYIRDYDLFIKKMKDCENMKKILDNNFLNHFGNFIEFSYKDENGEEEKEIFELNCEKDYNFKINTFGNENLKVWLEYFKKFTYENSGNYDEKLEYEYLSSLKPKTSEEEKKDRIQDNSRGIKKVLWNGKVVGILNCMQDCNELASHVYNIKDKEGKYVYDGCILFQISEGIAGKASIRSRKGSGLNVCEIAKIFGGGGHENAGAFKFDDASELYNLERKKLGIEKRIILISSV